MKKMILTIAAIVMLASMSTVAFASEITSDGGNKNCDVTATYIAGEEADTIYSVDVTWDSMEFTYTDASEGNWNPDNHSYEDIEEATWTGDGTIAVTNHTNAVINVGFNYTATDSAIAGAFSAEEFDLATAVETEVGSAPTNSTELTLSGELADTYLTLSKVGSVTVTISNATK